MSKTRPRVGAGSRGWLDQRCELRRAHVADLGRGERLDLSLVQGAQLRGGQAADLDRGEGRDIGGLDTLDLRRRQGADLG